MLKIFKLFYPKLKEKTKREVDPSEASTLARKIGVPYFETSAKSGYNVAKVFAKAASLAMDKTPQLAAF